MEPVGSISEAEWSSLSLSGMYSTTEEADFMAQLLSNPPLPPTFHSHSHSHSWPITDHDHQSMLNMSYPLGLGNNNHLNPFYSSHKSSYDGASSSSFCPTPTSSNGDYFLNDFHQGALSKGNLSIPMDFFVGDGKTNNHGSYPIEGNECLNHEMSVCTVVDQEPEADQASFPDRNSQDEKFSEMQVSDRNEDEGNVSGNKKRCPIPEVSTKQIVFLGLELSDLQVQI